VDEALARLAPGRRRAASAAVTQRLMNLPAVRAARTLMVFLSLPTEIDTWPIIGWAWREGKRVAVPRIEPSHDGADGPLERRDMVAVALEPADVEGVAAHPAVRPGPLGILQVPDTPPLDVSEIDVALVPCQAVDRSGNRLGKGGGFFDRFLARPDFRAQPIALAFHEQVLDQVPVAGGDRPVSMIVTDAEVLSFDPRPSVHP
jgi:5-formyltetrahydrofolate cyclo-ligase